MAPDKPIAFAGSVPATYDRELGPFYFEKTAEDLARRVAGRQPKEVLETACGTGISTRALLRHLPRETRVVATDVSEPMRDFAEGALAKDARLELRQADMMALPFADASFDVVATQFGIMFPPDKPQAAREARRVLRPNGAWVFNVWDSLEANPATAAVHRTVGELFPNDPPLFYLTPFGFHDRDALRSLVMDAGFRDATIDTVAFDIERPSARDVANGLITGAPILMQLQERTQDIDAVVDAVAEVLAREYGEAPLRTRIQEVVVVAKV